MNNQRINAEAQREKWGQPTLSQGARHAPRKHCLASAPRGQSGLSPFFARPRNLASTVPNRCPYFQEISTPEPVLFSTGLTK